MAVNFSHVSAAYENLKNRVEAVKDAIECKETESDTDQDRISAYDSFLYAIEEAFDDLTAELEDAKN